MALNFTNEVYRDHLFRHQVLVVDDEDRKLGEMTGIALANGFLCDFARSAPEAWSKLSKEPTRYELMISDNSMPTRDEPDDGYDYSGNDGLPLLGANDRFNEGLQLLRRVRDHPQLRSLDVIIYTGGGGREQAEALRATYIQQQPYILNDILRERSELYREAAQNPKEAKKGFLDFLKR